MRKKKICWKCHKKIKEKNEHFFEQIEYLEGFEVVRTYVHKPCWDEVKSILGLKHKVEGMFNGFQTFFQEQGILPKTEYEIK